MKTSDVQLTPFEGECNEAIENVTMPDGRRYALVKCRKKQGHTGNHKNQDITWPGMRKHSPRYNLNKLRQEILLLERLVQ